MRSLSNLWLRSRGSAIGLIDDCGGMAAIEFAFVVPLMLVMFFGTVEISSGVAVDRKVTLVARTLSDLTSQGGSAAADTVTDTDLKNFFSASYGILNPYSVTPAQATISEIYVNNSNVAKIQWSKAATVAQSGTTVTASLTTSGRNQGDTVTIPTALAVAGSYLILSEVSYLYTPTIGYVMGKAGVTLSDKSFTRPRQTVCVKYGTTNCTTF